MDAYLVPVLSALAGAILAASVLGAVRAGRWWAAMTGRGREPNGSPGPGIAGDAADPHVPRLAHRSLGAALLIGLTGTYFFAHPQAGPGADPALRSIAVGLALLVAWGVTWNPR